MWDTTSSNGQAPKYRRIQDVVQSSPKGERLGVSPPSDCQVPKQYAQRCGRGMLSVSSVRGCEGDSLLETVPDSAAVFGRI